MIKAALRHVLFWREACSDSEAPLVPTCIIEVGIPKGSLKGQKLWTVLLKSDAEKFAFCMVCCFRTERLKQMLMQYLPVDQPADHASDEANREEMMGNRPQAVGLELEVMVAADMAGSDRVH